MAKTSRQIRLDPEVEENIQKIAEMEGRSFSGACNWLLRQASQEYLAEHESKNE